MLETTIGLMRQVEMYQGVAMVSFIRMDGWRAARK